MLIFIYILITSEKKQMLFFHLHTFRQSITKATTDEIWIKSIFETPTW